MPFTPSADSTFLTADSTEWTADSDPWALPDAPATRDTAFYVGLITSWHRGKPRFTATIAASVGPFADGSAALARMPLAFDLDTAVGAQLDVDGEWIGRSRFVPVPLPNLFFSFDIATKGWDQGYWRGPYDGEDGISRLPDALYRRLLYAKIASNHWDGLIESAEAIVAAFLNDATCLSFIHDRGYALSYIVGDALFAFDRRGAGFDQSRWIDKGEYPTPPEHAGIVYAICIAGHIPPATDLYILGDGLIPLNAMGAKVTYEVTTVEGTPLFGFDMDDGRVGGWDVGAWGADPATVASLVY